MTDLQTMKVPLHARAILERSLVIDNAFKVYPVIQDQNQTYTNCIEILEALVSGGHTESLSS